MRAVIVVTVPDDFLEQRAREAQQLLPADDWLGAREYFGERVAEVAKDELPLALFGWPADIVVHPATPLVCRTCGGCELLAWYPVDQSQGVVIDGHQTDGGVAFDYDGVTSSGETGEDVEYRCRGCDDSAPTLEELVGLQRIWVGPADA